MPERNRGRIVKTKLEFRTVVQPNHLTARPDVTTVRGLTAISGGDRFDVIRPAPTWLERALAHNAISDPHDRPEESTATARTAVVYVRGPVAGGFVATDGSATDVVIGAVLGLAGPSVGQFTTPTVVADPRGRLRATRSSPERGDQRAPGQFVHRNRRRGVRRCHRH